MYSITVTDEGMAHTLLIDDRDTVCLLPPLYITVSQLRTPIRLFRNTSQFQSLTIHAKMCFFIILLPFLRLI